MNDALKTDLYQPSMSLGYKEAGKGDEIATYELSLRKLPPHRNYLVIGGIAEIIEYLQNLQFTKAQLDYLRQFPQFANLPSLKSLEGFRFTGDVFGMRDGTIAFQNEPVLYVRGPRWQAQYVETYLLGKFRSLTKFASRASRIVDAAGGSSILEFGSRHIDPVLAPICAKAAYMAGCAGTSNVEAGFLYGIPIEDIRGTMAHAYIESFPTELEAFRAYAKTYPDSAVLLVDTYDTGQGIKNAIIVAKELEAAGHKLRGIRIDSGDIAKDTKLARRLFADADLDYVKIVVSGDMDENKIVELKRKGAEIDIIGVGKAISTLDDAPHLDASYKLCEHEIGGKTDYAIKLSEGKATWPGLKQIYRILENNQYSEDFIRLANEPAGVGAPLIKKLMENGRLVYSIFDLNFARNFLNAQKRLLSSELRGTGDAAYKVEFSDKLKTLQAITRQGAEQRNGVVRKQTA